MHQRLRSGFYPALPALHIKVFNILDYHSVFLFYVAYSFFLYYRPIVAFTRLRKVEERRIAGDQGERSGRDQGKGASGRDLDTFLKSGASSIRARTTGQEREGTLSALRKDDEGRLTGARRR